MIKFNTHTHSIYSPDGHNTIEEFVNYARSTGISYIAFTDHFEPYEPIDYSDKINSHYLAMVKDIEKHKANAKKDGIHLECGIEVGYDKIGEKPNNYLIEELNIGYVINSLHYINNESCYYPSFFENRTKYEGYDLYLRELLKSLDANYRYDAIGHMSYCARNAPFDDPIMHYSDHKEIIDSILDKIIEKQKIIELNTSVRTAKSGVLPNEEILTAYKKRGGELITFASDAHWVEHIMDGFEIAKTIAKRVGFLHFVIKKDGKLEYVKID